MRTNVEFRSDKFPPYDGEEEEVNPDLWGKRLAEYITYYFNDHGIETDEFYAEDWGWEIPIKNDKFRIYLGCGHYQEYDDGYLIHITPSKPVIRRFFKKIDTRNDIEKIAKIIDKMLHEDKDIKAIRWWDENEI